MNLFLLGSVVTALVAAGGPVLIGKFVGSGAVPAPWRVVQIDKKAKPTIYRLATVAGVAAIEATASDSMALLGRYGMSVRRARQPRRRTMPAIAEAGRFL